MGSLAGEALSSHEAFPGGGSTAKFTGDVKGTLKLSRQSAGDGVVDAVVIVVTMSRIAASTIEAHAGKVIAIFCLFPGAGANEAISEDPLKDNCEQRCKPLDAWLSGNSGIWGSPVQLEQQNEVSAAGKFAEDEHRMDCVQECRGRGRWLGCSW